MKISLNLMQWYSNVDLKTLPTDELVKLATERLGGIEGVTDLSMQYEGIVVVKVVSCVKHPNADKLNLCKVDDGGVVKDVARDESGYVQVVCGAPNVREGLLAAWIPPSAIVPASYGEKELFVLEARDLRGQLSNGMLASPAELGMSDDHTGILEIDPFSVIPAQAGIQNNELDSRLRGNDEMVRPGTPFKDLYDLDDTIIEIENKMFTHRPDGFGHLGVAREIAGIQHKAFKSPEWYLNSVISTEVEKSDQISRQARDDELLSVSIEDDELCPRYMAVVLENVEINPSPIWLQSYLKRVGIRPINNVVDVTNYMMLLTAQPLHAFDFDKVASKASHPELDSGSNNVLDSRLRGNDEESARDDKKVEIIVRRPKDGEKMTLLDGKVIEPHKDAALICNSDGPIALGGVMGGGNSEVDENTKRVVLECATFDMYNIRRTSMIHGIFTDAVTRFTKGQPAAQLPAVIYQTIKMFEELAGAKQVGNIVDSTTTTNLKSQTSNFIEIDSKFINDRLGSKFSNEEIVQLLNNVEIGAHVASGPIEVTPPFWRTDLEIKEDIVEEIGRLYGFNNLPMALPTRNIKPVTPEPKRAIKSQIRHTLSRAGANEVLGYSFVHGNLLKKAGQNSEHAYAIRNALSPDLQYYRLSLLPSLLDRTHPNIKAGYGHFSLFELGKVHYKNEMDADEPEVPNEDSHLACIITYDDKFSPKGSAFFAAKRYLAEVAPKLVDNLVPMNEFDLASDEWGQQLVAPYEPARSALIIKDKQIWGVVGELKTEVQKAFKLPAFTAGFEIHLDALKIEEDTYKVLSKYPSTDQDVTLKVACDLPFSKLKTLIEEELDSTEYDFQVTPLGIYKKEGEATKNVTFRITLSHQERTLITNEVNKIVESISWKAYQELKAEQI